MEPLMPDDSPEPAIRRVRWSGCSDRGKIRANNEDAFVGLRFNREDLERLGREGESSLQTADFVFAVSDGMGGAQAGEVASRMAVEKVPRILPMGFRKPASGPGSVAPGTLLQALFREIHAALVYLGASYEECRGMETTLSVLVVHGATFHIAHVGDSRIYHLPAHGPGLRQVTNDDTYVGWLRRQGQINEREARSHPRRNILQKALGAGNQFAEPQIGAVAVEPGDTFLFCSDGLVDGLWDHAIADHLRESPTPSSAHALVQAALDGGSRDNVTVVVVRLD